MDKTRLAIIKEVIDYDDVAEIELDDIINVEDVLEAMKIAMKQAFGIGINFFMDNTHKITQSEIDLFFLEYLNKLEGKK